MKTQPSATWDHQHEDQSCYIIQSVTFMTNPTSFTWFPRRVAVPHVWVQNTVAMSWQEWTLRGWHGREGKTIFYPVLEQLGWKSFHYECYTDLCSYHQDVGFGGDWGLLSFVYFCSRVLRDSDMQSLTGLSASPNSAAWVRGQGRRMDFGWEMPWAYGVDVSRGLRAAVKWWNSKKGVSLSLEE